MTSEGTSVLRAVPNGYPARFPTALPEPVTNMVGRADEYDLIRRLVAEPSARLVTLVGPGGVGKTTLATAVARQLWNDYAGAVLFAPVTIATTPDGVWDVIAQCAGWEATDLEATRHAVRHGLTETPTLLVLDNCEQVTGLAELVGDVLANCPELVVIATSRRPVGIATEQLVPIEPLAVPTGSAGVRELADNDAATVLVNAARRRNPSFSVTRENAAAVAELCRRLDGLPLALELAAARLHLLPPHQLLDLLAHRFDVLKVDAGEKADRHRRLWATIDWSYQLLDGTDQARFRSLGVFADGFTLDAAAAVTGCSTVDMLDTIERLVAQNLVRSVPARAAAARFDLLESIREFAVAELDQRDELDPTYEIHAEWVREFAERWGPGLTDGVEQTEAVAVLDADRANVIAAVERSLEAGANERVLAIGVALWRYWWYRGLARAGRTWLEAALERGAERTAARASAYVVTSDLAEVTGDLPRARELILAALDIYEELGCDEEMAPAWNGLGFVERELGNLDRARALHEQALAMSSRLKNLRGQASALNGLGAVANRAGQQSAAIGHYRAALDIVRELGDRYAAALVAQNMAIVLHATGDLAGAIATLRQAHEESSELGDVQNMLVTLLNLADCEIAAEELDDAEQHLADAERLAHDTGIAHYPAIIAHHRGRIADRRGEVGEALELFATGLQVAIRVVRPIEMVEFLERIGALATELGDDDLAARAFGAARIGRAATGTPPIAEAVHWERTLLDRGVAIAETGRETDAEPAWPAPAEALAAVIGAYAASRAGARREGSTSSDPLQRLGLTAREAEVARLVMARRTDQEIAEELYVAVRTASTHVSAVLRKLGVSSRRDVAERLAELGITL